MAFLNNGEKNSQNYKNSKKALTVASTTLVAFVMVAAITVPSIALAASLHFVGTPTCTTSASGFTTKTLTCSGKIAGLGNVSTVTAQLVSTAITQCTNPGGSIPPGHQAVAGTPAVLPVQNGQTLFTLSVSASPNCPPPQAGSVTFTNVGVAVESTILPIPGTFDP